MISKKKALRKDIKGKTGTPSTEERLTALEKAVAELQSKKTKPAE